MCIKLLYTTWFYGVQAFWNVSVVRSPSSVVVPRPCFGYIIERTRTSRSCRTCSSCMTKSTSQSVFSLRPLLNKKSAEMMKELPLLFLEFGAPAVWQWTRIHCRNHYQSSFIVAPSALSANSKINWTRKVSDGRSKCIYSTVLTSSFSIYMNWASSFNYWLL
jgi:hypothetical protein